MLLVCQPFCNQYSSSMTDTLLRAFKRSSQPIWEIRRVRREYAPGLEPGRPGGGRHMSTGSAYHSINEWNQRWQLRIPTASSSVLSNISATARCDGGRYMSRPSNENMGHEFRVKRADSYWPRSIYKSVKWWIHWAHSWPAWRASLTTHSCSPFERRKSHCAWRTVWDSEISWI